MQTTQKTINIMPFGRKLLCRAWLLLPTVCLSLQLSADFDARRDFSLASNPTGTWSYGWANPNLAGFTLLSHSELSVQNVGRWYSPGLQFGVPAFFRNEGQTELVVDGFRAPPGRFWAHPGNGNVPAVLRWTAPSAGHVYIEANFASIDTAGSPKTLTILKGTMPVFAGTIGTAGQSPLVVVTNLSVTAAEIVTFAVGDTDVQAWADSVGIELQIRYGEAPPAGVSVNPALQSVILGSRATFEALPIGMNEPTYQWRHAGTNLLEDTRIKGVSEAHLTINSVTAADAGEYDVEVRDISRTLRSSPVRLLVNNPDDGVSPKQAIASAQVINGFVVGVTVIDGGRGYTNAPTVQIVGGGGFGAAATASVINGIVTAITVQNAGQGYSVAPEIKIDAPSYYPLQAQANAQVVNGFVVGVTIIEPGFGYGTNVPPVHIIGGGGTGAKAVATLSNGMVTGIAVVSAGSGYSSPPQILIAAPPGAPSLNILVSQVKLTLHLILGYTYVVQTSSDLESWTNVGSPFLAVESPTIVVADTTAGNRHFRVVQVP